MDASHFQLMIGSLPVRGLFCVAMFLLVIISNSHASLLVLEFIFFPSKFFLFLACCGVFRSTAAFPKASALASFSANSEDAKNGESALQPNASEHSPIESAQAGQHQSASSAFQFPFGDWLSNPWSKLHENKNTRCYFRLHSEAAHSFQVFEFNHYMCSCRIPRSDGTPNSKVPINNPLLPKITMVGISMGEAGQVSKAKLKKTMENLTKELEQSGQKPLKTNEEIDPLFVANVGDYSSITRMTTSWETEENRNIASCILWCNFIQQIYHQQS